MVNLLKTPKQIIIITGATATGKSSLALHLAKMYDADIINADALQVYKGAPILTANPEEVDNVPHELYAFIDGDQVFSVMNWINKIQECLDGSKKKNHIIVGGTPMYIRTLIDGISWIPDVDPNVAKNTKELFFTLGIVDFYKMVAQADPQIVDQVSPFDSHRLQRAFNVISSTNKSIFEWRKHKMPSILNSTNAQVQKLLIHLPRDQIYQRCDARFLAMLDRGALDEVGLMMSRYPLNAPIFKAIGAKQIAEYLWGEATWEQMIENATKETRHYAKRQLTWFRSKFDDFVRVDQFGQSLQQDYSLIY